MIYETEEFEVNDVEGFERAMASLQPAFEEAGAVEPRVLRHTEDPTRVLATIRWPSVEACLKFMEDHEADFQAAFGPLIVSMKGSERWEELGS